MEKCSSAAFQRIPFEQDVFFGDASCDGSATFQALPEMRPPAVGKKTKGCGLPPPRCQVEGCDLDLKGAKSYYWRHKVCGMHSKSPKVIVAGLEQRFCQQCSRFHLLKEFDQGKRSCRRRLAGHNERRRKAPPGLLPSRYGCLPSLPELNNRQRAFLMDFMHPRPPDATKDIILWPAARSNDRETSDLLKFSGGDMNNLRPALFSAPELAFGECIAGALDSTCALSLLSTKPWGLSAYSAGPKNERSAILITSTEFEMAQCRASECLSSSWVPKELVGGSNSSHELLLRQIQDAGGSCQFSGGLDLPAFEIRHCLNDVGPTSEVYDQLHDLHWPL